MNISIYNVMFPCTIYTTNYMIIISTLKGNNQTDLYGISHNQGGSRWSVEEEDLQRFSTLSVNLGASFYSIFYLITKIL